MIRKASACIIKPVRSRSSLASSEGRRFIDSDSGTAPGKLRRAAVVVYVFVCTLWTLLLIRKASAGIIKPVRVCSSSARTEGRLSQIRTAAQLPES